MGDIADDIIDGFWENDGTLDSLFDSLSYFPNTGTSVTCAYCKESGFYWRKVDEKWRLFKGEVVHDCKAWRKSLKLTRKEKKAVNKLRNNLMRKWKEEHAE